MKKWSLWIVAVGLCWIIEHEVIMSVSGSYPKSAQVSAGEYDRSGRNPHQSRSVVVAQNGMVATSHPLSAQVGIDILKAGGNAADAAIATSAMMGLVEPMSCGIGGDLFLIYWDNATQKLYGLNASGRSPYALNRKVFADQGLPQIPETGPLSWSVPGCVDGWDMLRSRFGTKSFAEILKPAIEYGEAGFPIPEVIAGYWAGGAVGLKDWPDSAATYLIDGRAPREGELFKNQRLAATYRQIGEHGRDAFYKGSIAERIVAFSEMNGGYFSMQDFEDHTSNWLDPVSTNYRGYDVWELPPNGQGIAVLQILNILEAYDIKSMGRNSADFIHLFVEAKKLAYADRAKYYADPDFQEIPVASMISKPYAVKRRQLIDPNVASKQVLPGDPFNAQADTIYLTVVDKDRNCCSLIQSNYYGFGSMVTPGDVGFVLQNRGSLFSLDEKHWNRLEPHKRPFHTIIPAFVTKEGKPWFSFGVMGGDMQPQGQVQVLVNMIDFGMNVQAAGDSSRVSHSGSQTPTGRPMEQQGGTVAVESAVTDETIQELIKRGHRVIRSRGGFGGYQGILIDWEHGTLHGATEARKDGAAVGY
ncbi:MAG: gamma-glutamyltransferase [Planctomycetota bacterium]|nr:gamma-glutamyltransferase [Planctomycetota bacterium]MDA1211403.1 gamma-glutamyltransferase [Planctomycetota bacterium]